MNGLRPKEIMGILRKLEDLAAEESGLFLALATAVSVDGSVYSRSGAMALLATSSAGRPGVVAGEDLQGELRRHFEAAVADGKCRLASVDVAEDDPILGYGLGSPGKVEILLEPVDPDLRGHMRSLRETLLKGEGVVYSVEIEGPEAGRRALYSPEHPSARECYREISPQLVESALPGVNAFPKDAEDGSPVGSTAVEGEGLRRIFLCPVHPMGKVLVFGSGRDALRLARHLSDLGFTVYAADPRPARLRNPDWDRQQVFRIEGGWEQARAAAGPDEDSSIVVMTHSFALDLETLQGALKSPAAYVGQIGPQKRTQRLLLELEKLEVRPRPGVFFAPAGLDIGAEAPGEVALGIAAEIVAARFGRKGGRVSPRRAPAAAPAKSRIPGLILAAGRGRRFAAGHKLSAELYGRPVLRHVVENALASRLDPVIVVLGCDAEAGLKALRGLEDARLRVVFNPRWEKGKASSIEAGLREAPHAAPGVVSLLGDMPMVKPWLIDRVISEFEISGKLAFPIYPGPDGPKKGYPTAFPKELFGEIRALTGDDTAMEAVRRHWSEAVRIPLEDASTQADVDTAEDLQLLLSAGS